MQWCCSERSQGSSVWPLWDVGSQHMLFHHRISVWNFAKYKLYLDLPKMWIFQLFRFFFFFFLFFFLDDQLNLENQNRFDPLTKEKKTGSSSFGTSKNNFIGGLKFVSININSIRGKKLELLAFLDFHQPHILAIQETKIDSSIATSELFPESCPYNAYTKRQKPSWWRCSEFENNSELVWVKVFANKTSHYVASWYRQPGGTSEDFQLFRDQLDHIRNQHKGKNLPAIHVLEDFNFRDIDWPDRLNKSDSALSQSKGQMLIDIMNNHGLEQLVHFPTFMSAPECLFVKLQSRA